jgi:hypothetical protein
MGSPWPSASHRPGRQILHGLMVERTPPGALPAEPGEEVAPHLSDPDLPQPDGPGAGHPLAEAVQVLRHRLQRIHQVPLGPGGLGSQAVHAGHRGGNKRGRPARFAIVGPGGTLIPWRGSQSMMASGRSDVLAALRAERHDLLQKRRLDIMSALDAARLAEVEKAMTSIQKPEIEAMARRNDALFERLENAVRALTVK